MVQFQEYSTAWVIYLLAIIGLLLVTWRLFRGVPSSYIRRMIIVTVAVLFITPVLNESTYWAPAWIVAILEILFTGIDGTMHIVNIVLSVWCVAIAVYSLIHVIFFRKKKGVAGDNTQATKPASEKHQGAPANTKKTPRRMATKV